MDSPSSSNSFLLQVEVLHCEENVAYPASVILCTDTTLLVSYNNSLRKDEEVPLGQCRLPPSIERTFESFQVGEECEVLLQEPIGGGMSWWKAKITKVENEFYVVDYNGHGTAMSYGVKKNRVRHMNTNIPLDRTTFCMWSRKVTKDLHSMCSQMTSQRAFLQELGDGYMYFNERTSQLFVLAADSKVSQRADIWWKQHLENLQEQSFLRAQALNTLTQLKASDLSSADTKQLPRQKSDFTIMLYNVPGGLVDQLIGDDQQHISEVIETSHVTCIVLEKDEINDAQDGKILRIMGEKERVDAAERELDFRVAYIRRFNKSQSDAERHSMDNQRSVHKSSSKKSQNWNRSQSARKKHAEREVNKKKQGGRLESQETATEKAGDAIDSFTVKPELMKFAIGNHGINIKKAEQLPGVTLVQLDDARKEFSIRGKTMYAVQAARHLLEIVEHCYNVPRHLGEKMLGQQGYVLKNMIKTSKVVNITVGKESVGNHQEMIVFNIIGTRESVSEAEQMIDQQITYLRSHEKMVAENTEGDWQTTDLSYGVSSFNDSLRFEDRPSKRGYRRGNQWTRGAHRYTNGENPSRQTFVPSAETASWRDGPVNGYPQPILRDSKGAGRTWRNWKSPDEWSNRAPEDVAVKESKDLTQTDDVRHQLTSSTSFHPPERNLYKPLDGIYKQKFTKSEESLGDQRFGSSRRNFPRYRGRGRSTRRNWRRGPEEKVPVDKELKPAQETDETNDWSLAPSPPLSEDEEASNTYEDSHIIVCKAELKTDSLNLVSSSTDSK